MERNQRVRKILTELYKTDPTGVALLHREQINSDWGIEFDDDYQVFRFKPLDQKWPVAGFYFGDTEAEAVDFMNELLNK